MNMENIMEKGSPLIRIVDNIIYRAARVIIWDCVIKMNLCIDFPLLSALTNIAVEILQSLIMMEFLLNWIKPLCVEQNNADSFILNNHQKSFTLMVGSNGASSQSTFSKDVTQVEECSCRCIVDIFVLILTFYLHFAGVN